MLALQSKPKESNDLFTEVFALDPRLVGPGKDKKGKGPAGPLNLRQLEQRFEQRLAPIKPLLNHPRGKHWLAKARWYNARNGLPTAQVPRYLLWLFPLESELKK